MPLSSGTIKFISSLRQKKVRQTYHKFTAEGGRIVGELLAQERYRIDHVYALPQYLEGKILPPGLPVTEVSPRELGRISQLTTPNQVLAVVHQLSPEPDLPDELAQGWSLYLDGIQSPSNLGALLRIADWFGFPHLIAGPGTADLYNSKTIQASMGSFLRVSVHPATFQDVVERFPDLPRYAADAGGQNVFDFSPPPRGLLVLGTEGRGIDASTATRVNGLIAIPRGPARQTESLNVSVAAGILCAALAHRLPA